MSADLGTGPNSTKKKRVPDDVALEPGGKLQSIAASILMMILYVARNGKVRPAKAYVQIGLLHYQMVTGMPPTAVSIGALHPCVQAPKANQLGWGLFSPIGAAHVCRRRLCRRSGHPKVDLRSPLGHEGAQF